LTAGRSYASTAGCTAASNALLRKLKILIRQLQLLLGMKLVQWNPFAPEDAGNTAGNEHAQIRFNLCWKNHNNKGSTAMPKVHSGLYIGARCSNDGYTIFYS